ncbi:hypothetical protein [Clostridium felsineum]|uniref:Uncharacterized protein n=1 Tax=Clostridium felsineum TaxID=36839 RepID=A0A1S8MDQ2_9CLOT|nr:hypothetical protein [Clostridium felsineum]URZ06434.1 hypothetical protein CLROS_017670 [Clostridium felsineum]URZ11469.1 hypothetical protein CROST_021860 [Clostridium felsineum]
MERITPIHPTQRTKQQLHHKPTTDFQNILENRLDIDHEQIYDTETNETICDIDNMDEATLNKLLEEHPIEYDKIGRMNYNPIFHARMRQPWTVDELNYVINWYDKVGPDELSFALERTIKSVMQKATDLRKQGKMPQIQGYHKRVSNISC